MVDDSEDLSSFGIHDRDIFKGKKKLSHSFQTFDNKGELKIPRFNTQQKQIGEKQEQGGQKGRCWDTCWVFLACLGYTGTLAGSSWPVWATQGCQTDKNKTPFSLFP